MIGKYHLKFQNHVDILTMPNCFYKNAKAKNPPNSSLKNGILAISPSIQCLKKYTYKQYL